MGEGEPGAWIPAFRKQYDEAHGPYQWRNIYEVDEELFIYADALQAESKRRKQMSELRQKIDHVIEMLDPAFNWEAYWEQDEFGEQDSLDDLFRECIVEGFPEGEEAERYYECGSAKIEDTPKALYRLLFLLKPKEKLDFSYMYKGYLIGFFSADKQFLVGIHFFKYELGLYFYAPKEAIDGKGYSVQAGAPGADNGWHIADEDGKAFFEMITKALNTSWEVYPGNDFKV